MDFRVDSCMDFFSFGYKNGREFLHGFWQGFYLNFLGALPSQICEKKNPREILAKIHAKIHGGYSERENQYPCRNPRKPNDE
jgi:hypothetical protein